MNNVVKTKWIEALRSGNFVQGRSHLKIVKGQKVEYCCLGVLCEIHATEQKNQSAGASHGWIQCFSGQAYYGSGLYLPYEVVQWAGLDESNPMVDTQEGTASLADLNDGDPNVFREPKSFKEIADLIEKNL